MFFFFRKYLFSTEHIKFPTRSRASENKRKSLAERAASVISSKMGSIASNNLYDQCLKEDGEVSKII